MLPGIELKKRSASVPTLSQRQQVCCKRGSVNTRGSDHTTEERRNWHVAPSPAGGSQVFSMLPQAWPSTHMRSYAKDAFASDQPGDAPLSRAQAGVSSQDHELSSQDFHRFADLTLGGLLDKLETYLDDMEDMEGSDVEYGQGVLSVHLGEKGTFVINKQAPNKQIWLSSPVSGPARYDCAAGGRWLSSRDGHDLLERLAQEIEQLCGPPIDLEPEDDSGYGPDPT
ncbi:hypothetical protein WJX72_008378 [[Myrmecia] bisecta]|uniref:ferroxidase n=1 Tax=[Myrmecia] bisecta TaxID=41462 RepID=A0AAW1QSQ0_9CHLO